MSAANLVPGFIARTKWAAGGADSAEAEEGSSPTATTPLPQSIKFLHFSTLWDAYPAAGPLELAEKIGGDAGRQLLEASAATSACAALSYALIQCGVELPASQHTLADAEGRQLITKPSCMLEYLRDAMGREHHCKDMASAVNRSGILVFLGADGAAASVDVWRGSAPADTATVSGSTAWTHCHGAVLFEMPAPSGPHLHAHERASFPGGTKSLQAQQRT